jgi:uncharacterized membrane protein YozB (DUF420 family)
MFDLHRRGGAATGAVPLARPDSDAGGAAESLFIIVIMVLSLRYENVPGEFVERPFEPFYLVVVIHAVLGTVAEGLAIYCLLAGHKILPRKIGRLRYWMWATFIVWTAAVVMGVYTYFIWYIATPERPHLF